MDSSDIVVGVSGSGSVGGGEVMKPRTSQTNLDLYALPMIQKKIIQRTCKGPVSIKRVDPKGEYIVIENTCIKKPIVLTNWVLKRRGVDVPANSFKFEKHFVLHPNRQVKIYAKDKGKNNPPHELMSDSVATWGVGTYAFTILYNHLNQEKASLLEKVEHYERDLQVNVNKSSSSSINEQNHRSTGLGAGGGGGVGLSFGGIGDGFETYTNAHDSNYDRDFEFYFERNIRP